MNLESLRIGLGQRAGICRQGEKKGEREGGRQKKKSKVKRKMGRQQGKEGEEGRKKQREKKKTQSMSACAPLGPQLYNMYHFLLLDWF